MKKIIVSMCLIMALVLGAIYAWNAYHDILAVALFWAAIIPGNWLTAGVEELKGKGGDEGTV